MLSVFRRVKNSFLSLLFILLSEAILLWHGTQWLRGGGTTEAESFFISGDE